MSTQTGQSQGEWHPWWRFAVLSLLFVGFLCAVSQECREIALASLTNVWVFFGFSFSFIAGGIIQLIKHRHEKRGLKEVLKIAVSYFRSTELYLFLLVTYLVFLGLFAYGVPTKFRELRAFAETERDVRSKQVAEFKKRGTATNAEPQKVEFTVKSANEDPQARQDVSLLRKENEFLRGQLNETSNKLSQAERKVAALDPLAQPIASVNVFFRGVFPSDKRGNHVNLGQGAIVAIFKGKEAILFASATEHLTMGNGVLTFTAECAPNTPLMGKPMTSLLNAEYMQVAFNQSYMPLNTVVETGTVTLVINNQITLAFKVPKQKMDLEKVYGEKGTLLFVADLEEGMAPLRKAEDRSN